MHRSFLRILPVPVIFAGAPAGSNAATEKEREKEKKSEKKGEESERVVGAKIRAHIAGSIRQWNIGRTIESEPPYINIFNVARSTRTAAELVLRARCTLATQWLHVQAAPRQYAHAHKAAHAQTMRSASH